MRSVAIIEEKRSEEPEEAEKEPMSHDHAVVFNDTDSVAVNTRRLDLWHTGSQPKQEGAS